MAGRIPAAIGLELPIRSCPTGRHKFLRLASDAAIVSALSSIANAQTYRVRPITLVVPFAAGGPTDVVGRIVAERMRSSLGQPMFPERAAAWAPAESLAPHPMAIRPSPALCH